MSRQFKRIIVLLLIVVFTLVGCVVDDNPTGLQSQYAEEIASEYKKSFDFFWNEANTDENSMGYGLIVDRWPSRSAASIASVGFGLAAIPIGIEQGWITNSQGKKRVLGTLNTFYNMRNVNGFYYHFVDMQTGDRNGNCELSIIDSALFICGALLAGEYFGGEVKARADELYARMNWKWFVRNNNGKKQFAMSYDEPGHPNSFTGYWDFYAEQLILYVLGAGAPNEQFRTDKVVYDDFTKKQGTYKDNTYIYSWFGSAFTYQYSHAFIDFRKFNDADGINWFDNSIAASKASYQYSVDNKKLNSTFSEKSWGLTACDVRGGYNGLLGTPPKGHSGSIGVFAVAPTAAIGSVVFTPEQSLVALKNYQSLERLNTKYGVMDSYNLDQDWYSLDCIGIDKGIGLLMLDNYLNEFVWNTFMKIDYITNGLTVLEFVANGK